MTNIPRLFVPSTLCQGEVISLADGQTKYLTRVMRLAQGAKVRAFDGLNGEWMCQLQVAGKRAGLEPLQQTRQNAKSLDLTLLFAPLKKTRTDFVVEKASELGVRNIWPVITQYTQSGRVRSDRLQALAIEAAEQTERMDIAQVSESRSLSVALDTWDPDIPLYYCDEGSEARPMVSQVQANLRSCAGILIGPEGGFSPKERELIRSLDFVHPVTLGPRILRAETAVVCALTIWQSIVGDWQQAPYLRED